MTNKEAIEILTEELHHTEQHLTAKDKAPDYYEELGNYCESVRMAINTLAVEARLQGEWIPVSERLPEEKINPDTMDFEYVLCSTIWYDVRPYKYGKPIGHDKAHFWHGGGIMDGAVIAWQPLPKPYKEGGAE